MFSAEERDRIDGAFEQLESSPFSGAVALCAGADDVFERTFGRVDATSELKVTSSTYFDLCSVTKTFTAAAVRTLETDRRLALHQYVGEFLDALPDEIANVRVYQLLNHSSGLPDIIGSDGRACEYSLANDYRALSRDAFLESVRRSRLLFSPGSQWSYSNAGYSLLAAIVEILTGITFEDYLRRTILSPLGMDDTRYTLSPDDRIRTAAGQLDSREWRPPMDTAAGPSWNLVGNGGLWCTISNVIRWRQVFCSQRRPGFDDSSADHRVAVDRSLGIWSGCGRFFHETESDLGTVVYHNGSNSIYSATLRWVPRQDRYVAVLSSSATVTAMAVARTICGLWRSDGIPLL
jgi:CubicO group peptidase (beta-lactamase class C family)